MTDAADRPPTTQPADIEGGIFNLVITLCRMYEVDGNPEPARERVALYLERLISGLKTTTEEEGERSDDS